MLALVDDVLNGRSVSWLTDYSMVSKDYGEARIIDSTIDIQYLVSLYWAIVTMTTGKASIFVLVSGKANTFGRVKMRRASLIYFSNTFVRVKYFCTSKMGESHSYDDYSRFWRHQTIHEQ